MNAPLPTQYTLTINGTIYQPTINADPIVAFFGGSTFDLKADPVVFNSLDAAQQAAEQLRTQIFNAVGLTPIIGIARRYCTDWMFDDPAAGVAEAAARFLAEGGAE